MSLYLGEFEQHLLFALLHLDRSAHGVALRRKIQELTGRNIASGALYTAMDRLEQRGFVTSVEGEATPARGGRRMRIYTLELAGARALAESQERMQRMSAGALPALLRWVRDGRYA